MHTDRVNFLDLHFNRLTFDDVTARLQTVTARTGYGYVVTPNVDHVVMFHRDAGLRHIYEAADLCVCDSRILRFLARLRGVDLPLVPGSDLTAALFSEVIQPGDRIAVVGGSTESISALRSLYSAVEFVHHQPPMGLLDNPAARRAAAAFVASANARFALIAVGSPQQELIAKEARSHSGAGGFALCVGAGLDFLIGKQKRAPRMLRMLGLEWAHRLATNPRRLWRRYLVVGPGIFPIFAKWRNPARSKRWPVAALALLAIVGTTAYVTTSRTGQSTPRVVQSALPRPTSGAPLPLNLPPPDLLRPLTPDQAAAQNAERPFVNRPDTAASKFVLRTDAEDRERAITCLTQAVYYEAASEGVDGERAVAQVVLNRLHHPGYPSTICGVVYEGAERTTGCQFTFVCDGSLQRVPVAALWARSRKIAQDAVSGKVFAPIGHATHYHADYVLPYWADSLDKTLQIGRHIFYRLRSSLGDGRSFFQRYAGAEPSLPKPDATVVVPGSTDAERLANALISDDVNGSAPEVEKVAQAASPLLIDSSRGTLVADQQGSVTPSAKRKPVSDCAIGERKQLVPLGANDMRSSANATTC
jgi:N-acetylglucosaminyldiphosphoundecaprenol N-acetyl-beta-D-mannosaminyltransferase